MNHIAGNERSAKTSSSRKGKKNSDKPKQPQRGLGVAQLEKIRLHSQLGFQQTDHMHLQVYIHLLTQLAKIIIFHCALSWHR